MFDHSVILPRPNTSWLIGALLVTTVPQVYYEYMKSKWFKFKEKAIALRKKGLAMRKIEEKLRIPRSTLSEWFKNIDLSKSQKAKLLRDWKNGLVRAREKAALWHRAQKEARIAHAKKEALRVLAQINTSNVNLLELALAILYLGEGSKKAIGTSLGSSDPLILQFYISALRTVYGIDISRIKAELHLRADQDVNTVRKYWSQTLGLPLGNFTYVSVDQRTRGSKTYPTYNGVCDLRCGSPEIQRRLIFLSTFFCQKVAKDYLGS